MASIDLFFDDLDEEDVVAEVNDLGKVAQSLGLEELFPIELNKEDYLRELTEEEIRIAAGELTRDEDDLFADDLELAVREEAIKAIKEDFNVDFNADELFSDGQEGAVAEWRSLTQEGDEAAVSSTGKYDIERYVRPLELEYPPQFRILPNGTKIPFERQKKDRR